MPGGRFLILLVVLAAGLLTVALAISTGEDSGTTAVINGLTTAPPSPGINWGQAASAIGNASAPTSRGELLSLLVGFLAGWLLRWAYALPWATLPRAVMEWVLSWRTSAVMTCLALGCTVILLFY